MTTQSISGGITIPSGHMPWSFPGQFALNSHTIDATNEKMSFIFSIPKTGTVSKIGFLLGTVTTGDTLYVGLKTLDGSGNPTAVNYGGSTVGTQVVADGDDNASFTVSLGTSASVVKGDMVGVVIGFNSYVAGNIEIRSVSQSTFTATYVPYPTGAHYTTTWSRLNSTPIFWLEYDDGSYTHLPGVAGINSLTTNVHNSGSTPDEHALLFSLPINTRCIGFCCYVGTAASGANFDIILYDSDGSTVLATKTILDIHTSSAVTANGIYGLFDTPVSLVADTLVSSSCKTNNS